MKCRRGFLLPVPVLSPLFRRLMLEKIAAAHKAGKLKFFGEQTRLADEAAFKASTASASGPNNTRFLKRNF